MILSLFLSLSLSLSVWQIPFLTANSSSVSQEIPRILWNPKVHHRVNKSLQLVRFPNHTSPVHCLVTECD